jgi:hypothetical protein
VGTLEFSDQHPNSGRIAQVVDEGSAIWLYLTSPDGSQIVSDCWLQNLISAPISIQEFREKRTAPPATQEFVFHPEPGPVPSEIDFIWASDGGAVAIQFDGVTMGFIDCRCKFGFSRNLIKEGPFGFPFDPELFASLFGHSS